jgi:hypothetical protein
VPTTIVTTNTTTTRFTISEIATTTMTIIDWVNVPCRECYLKALQDWMRAGVLAGIGFMLTLIGILAGGWDDPSNWYNLYQYVNTLGQPPPKWEPLPTRGGGRPPPPRPGAGTRPR